METFPRALEPGQARAAQPLQLRQTFGYFAAFVSLGLAAASMGPTLLGLAQRLHAPLSAMSYCLTAGSVGYLLGSYQGGRLYDRVRGHPVMAGMLLVVAAGLFLVPRMPALWLLIAVRLLMGLGQGALDVGGNTLLLWTHGAKVGPYMSSLHFFWGVGAFLSPLIIAQLLLRGAGLEGAYAALAVLMLPPALWLLSQPSPRHPRLAGENEPIRPARPLLVLLTAGILFLFVAVEVGLGDWIATYAVRVGLGDNATAAYLTSAFWGALTAGRFLSIPLAIRFRPQDLLGADLLGCLLGTGVLLAAPQSAPAVWAGVLIVGVSMASVFPCTVALAGRLMTVTGRVGGWLGVGSSAGGMVLPWIIGQL